MEEKSTNLNLDGAKRTLNFFAEEPEWLANPYTSKVANTAFAAASDIIGKHVQLERLKNDSEAAMTRNSTIGLYNKMYGELLQSGENVTPFMSDDGAPVFSKENFQTIASIYSERMKSKPETTAGKILSERARIEASGDKKALARFDKLTEKTGRLPKPSESEVERKKNLSMLETQDFDYSKDIDRLQRDKDAETDADKKAAIQSKILTAGKQRERIKLQIGELKPQAPKRIAVKSPEGRTGTIEEGDTLPEGWSKIE